MRRKPEELVSLMLPPQAASILRQVFEGQRAMTMEEALVVSNAIIPMSQFSYRIRGEEQCRRRENVLRALQDRGKGSEQQQQASPSQEE